MTNIINIYSESEQELILVERACGELKHGNGVIIENNGKTFLIFHPETINSIILERIIQNYPQIFLLIASNRVKYILPEYFSESDLLVDIKNTGYEQIMDLAIFAKEKINAKLNIGDYLSDDESKLAKKLCKIAELLPNLIVVPVDNILDNFVKLTTQNIENYVASINNVHKISETKLHLKNITQAKIIAFRNLIAGVEHYAIVIGDVSHTKSPLIRIHSSCYTGDVLSSISCDCRDQLHTAIKVMEENKDGGIILYLMQEGRGIGLTSKLKTYNLQDAGLDTVEANEILGYEDDERSFQAAASMLKSFNISQVKILSNNPKKGNELTEYGVKVLEVVPIIPSYHNASHQYIQTKIDKMGHKINPNHIG
jgi:GTP cyclohydrolase II